MRRRMGRTASGIAGRWFTLVVLGALVVVGLFAAVGVQAAANYGFKGISFLGANFNPTAEKPQSKLWHNDGLWWGCLYNRDAGSFQIYRYNWNTYSWTSTGTVIDVRSASSADMLWDGAHLYAASAVPPGTAGDTSIRVMRYSYSSATQTYSLDSGFPVTIATSAVEAVVVDRDTQGRLWVTYTDANLSGGRNVYVTHTTSNDTTWVTPYVIPTASAGNLSSDDISAVVAFNGKIGVMWSHSTQDTVYFATHTDGDPDNVWALTPALQGASYVDDHISLKSLQADSAGQVFAAVKTSTDYPGSPPDSPLILLLTLDNHGSWQRRTFGTVADNHTRPIVLLDEQNRDVYIFATLQYPGYTTGAIYYKKASLDNSSVQFPDGVGTPFIELPDDPDFVRVNNASSTKQALNGATNLLVIAGSPNTKFYFHNFIDLEDPSAPAPFQKSTPADGATDQPLNLTLSWGTSSGATSYEYCYDIQAECTGSWTSTTETSVGLTGLSASTTYYWQVRARNAGGTTDADAGAWWSFATETVASCYALTLAHTGAGADPAASPANSVGCPSAEYVAGEVITLTAAPAEGYDVEGWSGTGDDDSTDTSNTATMPAAPHTVSVAYVPDLPDGFGKLNPADAAAGQPLALTISWQASSGAATYEYCYSAGAATCSDLWTSTAETSAGLSGLTAGTTYYWQVRARNANGTTDADDGAWWSFATEGSASCYALTIAHTGQGSDPTATPLSSIGCTSGQYVVGEAISLTAAPSAGYHVGSWSGTGDDASTSVTNALTMPAAAHTVTVGYVAGPPNDYFADALVVATVPYSNTQSTAGATSSADDPTLTCGGSPSKPAGVWYSYTPAASGVLVVSTVGSDYDTALSLWTGTKGSLAAADCVDDYDTPQAVLARDVVAGTTYSIQVSGHNNAIGNLKLSLRLLTSKVYGAQAGKSALIGYDSYQSDVRLLNPSASPAGVFLQVYAQGSSTPAYVRYREIPARGGASFNLQFLPLPDGFYGSAIVTADSPVLAIVNSSDLVRQNKGYTTASAGETSIWLPAIFKNYYEWTTSFSLENTSATAASVTVNYYNLSGTLAYTRTDSIPAASVRVYDQKSETALGSAFGGAVWVSSTQPLVASVAEESPTMPDTAAYGGFPASAGATTVYAPSVLKNAWGWVSDIRVQNVGTASTDISIEFYSQNGALTHTLNSAVPARSAKGFNEGGIAQLPNGWAGSAKIISSSQPVVVIVNELHDSGAFLSYEGFPAASGTTTLYAPSVLKNAWGWVSDIRVQNLGTAPADVKVEFFKFDGTLSHTITGTIPLHAVAGYNEGSITALGAMWEGWARVTCTNGQPIVAIVNEMYTGGGGIAYGGINN